MARRRRKTPTEPPRESSRSRPGRVHSEPPPLVPDLSPQAIYRRLQALATSGQRELAAVSGRRGRRPLILDVGIRQDILNGIRVGCFEWVAIAAAGVSQRTFQYWIEKGEKGIEPYVQFFRDVEQARGIARRSAEMRVHEAKPELWLREGPGRERPGKPGWTREMRAEITTPEGEPIEAEFKLKLDDDELRQIAQLAQITGLLPPPDSGDQSEADTPPAE